MGEILESLGVEEDVPLIEVWNKIDALSPETRAALRRTDAKAKFRVIEHEPEGRSEDFAAAVLAANPPGSPDTPAEFYQGGQFCGDEYSADFATLKAKA